MRKHWHAGRGTRVSSGLEQRQRDGQITNQCALCPRHGCEKMFSLPGCLSNNQSMLANSTERRHAPRYAIDGAVLVRLIGADNRLGDAYGVDILDISLNGALLSLPAGLKLESKQALQLEINVETTTHMSARAHVAHVHGERFGVEFNDMDPRDFDVFCGLVLMLEQRSRAALFE